jgi:hypothetical protein
MMAKWSTLERVLAGVGLAGTLFVLIMQIELHRRDQGMPTIEGVKKIEAATKSQLPLKVDDITTLVDVKYTHVKADAWFVVDLGDSDPPTDLVELEQQAHHQLCNDYAALTLIQKGYSYTYHYASKEGRSLGDFTITTCP